ncbi:MAG TPA: cysteinyl-tRNA synthetase [Chloroflexota bacterium]
MPGPIVLFGSGEAAPTARRAHAVALERLMRPVRAAVLETPAGFEPNSARVASRLAEYLRHRFQLETRIVPARKRGTPESPDEAGVVEPLLTSNYIMLGPGSPTYAVRQLAESLAWQIILARHRMGAALVLASAAAIATSLYALPVYEIYKVGQDLHWQPGLDLLGPFGGRIVVVPHWNNHEGGEELDTSHSYMGLARFERLCAILPPDVDILGVDEHTAALLDFVENRVLVLGRGGMTWLHHGGESLRVEAGGSIALETLGLGPPPSARDGIPAAVWELARRAGEDLGAVDVRQPTDLVQALLAERTAARASGDWSAADELRERIAEEGWEIRDTPDGPELIRN